MRCDLIRRDKSTEIVRIQDTDLTQQRVKGIPRITAKGSERTVMQQWSREKPF